VLIGPVLATFVLASGSRRCVVEQRALFLGVRDFRLAMVSRFVTIRGSRAPGSRHAHLHRELTSPGTRFEP
jgi:hypothetical protein